jgi:hypothetical protein
MRLDLVPIAGFNQPRDVFKHRHGKSEKAASNILEHQQSPHTQRKTTSALHTQHKTTGAPYMARCNDNSSCEVGVKVAGWSALLGGSQNVSPPVTAKTGANRYCVSG